MPENFQLPFKFRRKSLTSDGFSSPPPFWPPASPSFSPPQSSSSPLPSSPAIDTQLAFEIGVTIPDLDDRQHLWDPIGNYPSAKPSRHTYSLSHFGSSFPNDGEHAIPFDFDVSDYSEDVDSCFARDTGLRASPSAAGKARRSSGSKYSVLDSDDEGEEVELRPETVDSDVRGTFFTVSAERGRWKNDPRPILRGSEPHSLPNPSSESQTLETVRLGIEVYPGTTGRSQSLEPDHNTPLPAINDRSAIPASPLPSSSPLLPPSSPIQLSPPSSPNLMPISPTPFSPVSPTSIGLASPPSPISPISFTSCTSGDTGIHECLSSFPSAATITDADGETNATLVEQDQDADDLRPLDSLISNDVFPRLTEIAINIKTLPTILPTNPELRPTNEESDRSPVALLSASESEIFTTHPASVLDAWPPTHVSGTLVEETELPSASSISGLVSGSLTPISPLTPEVCPVLEIDDQHANKCEDGDGENGCLSMAEAPTAKDGVKESNSRNNCERKEVKILDERKANNGQEMDSGIVSGKEKRRKGVMGGEDEPVKKRSRSSREIVSSDAEGDGGRRRKQSGHVRKPKGEARRKGDQSEKEQHETHDVGSGSRKPKANVQGGKSRRLSSTAAPTPSLPPPATNSVNALPPDHEQAAINTPNSQTPAQTTTFVTDPSPPLPDEELLGMLIESMVTSRASSLPASSLYRLVMQSRPTVCARQSEREWMTVFERLLEEGRAGCGVFGKVESSWKDDAGRALEAQWFYVPERDEDQERAMLIRSMLPRPGKRSETKKYKQYYYRPLEKMSKWDPEDAL